MTRRCGTQQHTKLEQPVQLASTQYLLCIRPVNTCSCTVQRAGVQRGTLLLSAAGKQKREGLQLVVM